MIRRDLQSPGQPPCWVLFSQPDHAILSGEIARAWQSPCFAPLEPEHEVLHAIYHHDDGWQTWERHPQVDVEQGRPLAFNEMPLAVALPIWQSSIDQGLSRSPLVAYAIAGHFVRLLKQFDSWKADDNLRSLAEPFLAGTEAAMSGWLAAWTSASAANEPHLAARAVEFVRLFDAISLWLLCAERTVPASFETPSGPPVTFAPFAPGRIAVEPWPFRQNALELSASGRKIAARRYHSSEDLQSAPAEPVEYRWTLLPAAKKI